MSGTGERQRRADNVFSYTRSPFGDTGFFYALVDKDDRYHDACHELFREACQQNLRIVTTNFVVAESHALILSRLGYQTAADWLEAVEDLAWIERVIDTDEHRAKEIIRTYQDKDFSYTDTTCFAVMERLGMTIVLSVDEHFVQYGKFWVLPLQGRQLLVS
ncbi:MAG: type II toxin-antitoxin system VapC family toxin [Candidatus Latescibacteria bacterium]|nr:type II toxin-antitoxin system VapC family toxin [Candidatus Latescibacterota bacterium]